MPARVLKFLKALALLPALTFFLVACGENAPSSENSGQIASDASDTTRNSPAGSADTAEVDAPAAFAGPVLARGVFDERYLEEALSLIASADSEIMVAQFLFSWGGPVAELQDALAEAAKRGVEVRVLLDEEVERSQQAISHLVKLGINAKLDSPDSRTHVKMILVDRKRALFGSTNWSASSIEKTNESNLYIESPAAGAVLAGFYESLWSAPEADINIRESVGGGIMILTDRTFEPALGAFIDNAERLDIQMYAGNYDLNYPDGPAPVAIDSVCAKALGGVPVRAIIEESDYNQTTNELNAKIATYLASCGVDVRRDPIDRTSHSKMVLSEDGVLMGSANWGYRAFREYHELNARIDTGPVADDFHTYFERLWSEAAR